LRCGPGPRLHCVNNTGSLNQALGLGGLQRQIGPPDHCRAQPLAHRRRTFDKQRQLTERQLRSLHLPRRWEVMTALQALGEQAQSRAVEVQDLAALPVCRHKHEEVTGRKCLTNLLLDDERQSVEAASHVARLTKQVHLHTTRQTNHGCLRRSSATCSRVKPVTRAPHGNSRLSPPTGCASSVCFAAPSTIVAFLNCGLSSRAGVLARGAIFSAQRCIDDSDSPSALLTRRCPQP